MAIVSKSVLLGTCLAALGLLAFSGPGERPVANRTAEASDNGSPVRAPSPDVAGEKNPAPDDGSPAGRHERRPTLTDLSRAAEKRIRRAMQTKIDVTLKETKLGEFVDSLSDQGKIPIYIHEAALTEEGITVNTPLTDELRGVTIEYALNWTLEPLSATWVIEDEVLKVTTEIEAEEMLVTRAYDVSMLLAMKRQYDERRVTSTKSTTHQFSQLLHRNSANRCAKPQNQVELPAARRLTDAEGGITSLPTELMQISSTAGGGRVPSEWPELQDSDWLIELIATVTSGPWWGLDGAGGNMDIINGVLFIRETRKVQEEVENVLRALNDAASGKAHGGSIPARPATYPFAEDRKIRVALTKTSSFKYADTPLSSIAADLSKQHSIRIRLDNHAMKEEGISSDEALSIHLNGISLGSALYIMLEPIGLTYYVAEGTLWITTELEAEEILYAAVYDVGDLAEPGDEYQSLIEVIQQETSGPWGPVDGTGGEIREAEQLGALAIRQTHKVHREVTQLLADLRATIASQPKVSKPEHDADAFVTRVYDPAETKLVDDLLTAVPRFIAPKTWEEGGKAAAIQQVGESLVIRQTIKVHQQIERFLRQFGYHLSPRSGVGFF